MLTVTDSVIRVGGWAIVVNCLASSRVSNTTHDLPYIRGSDVMLMHFAWERIFCHGLIHSL